MVDFDVTVKTYLSQTFDQVKELDKRWRYKRIFIDDAGLGAGVFDMLMRDGQVNRRLIGLNNATRSLDKDETKRKKLLKEDLYSNLLMLMERGKLELFDLPEIAMSLRSVQYEYADTGIKIFGNYTHIAEALIRAAWCYADKSLNIWIGSP